MRPSVAILIPGLNAGGAERVLLSLASEFVARGIRCEVVSVQRGGVWRSKIPEGVSLMELGFEKPIRAIYSLWKYLRYQRPEVLLTSITNTNILALLACRLPGVKCKCVIREANMTELDLSDGSAVKRLLTTLAIRALYPRADSVIALSEGLKADLGRFARISSDVISVIPNPVLAPSDDLTGRLDTHIPDHPPLIVACGRLAPQKDYPTLLRAFASLPPSSDARLAILGTGSLEPTLRDLAKQLQIDSSVEFVGYSAEPAAWMHRASIFVLSSRWEGFPNVLMEALACGRPVISTDCSDSIREILGNGKFGSIVPVGDSDAIAQAMLAILNGEVRFASARAHLDTYSLRSIADRYTQVLSPTSAMTPTGTG